MEAVLIFVEALFTLILVDETKLNKYDMYNCPKLIHSVPKKKGLISLEDPSGN